MLLSLNNFDLLSVGLTVAGITVLGFAILFNNPRSVTNRSYFYFCLISALWGFVNYLNYKFSSELYILLFLRLLIFLATWHAYSLLRLVYVFPEATKDFSRKHKFILLPLVILTSIVTLTPLAFSQISSLSAVGQVSTVAKGPGMLLFLLVTIFNIISAFYILYKKTANANGISKPQLKVIFIGLLITFFLIGIFNFLLPALFDINKYIPLGALFILPFIGFTAYSIYRQKLFNIKIASTAALTFVLTVVTFIEVIFSNSLTLILFRSGVFILILVFGVLLMKGVLKEILQREKIQVLAEELKVANEGQANLMHIMNHQIKGRLGVAKNIFAELLTDDYGHVPDESRYIIQKGLEETDMGVQYVQGILNGTSAESGNLPYDMVKMDLKEVVTAVVEREKDLVQQKGLGYEFRVADGNYSIQGDPTQLREVIKNMIDNSINYTPTGKIMVSLERKDNKVLFAVKDTGIGLSEDDKPKLFKTGGRGKDSAKINVNSTGYGLAFVKGVVEAHKGRVWAESEGSGKGSQFYVELPIA